MLTLPGGGRAPAWEGGAGGRAPACEGGGGGWDIPVREKVISLIHIIHPYKKIKV